jgi:hypothetical protein
MILSLWSRVSGRRAPGRGSSLSAASRLPRSGAWSARQLSRLPPRSSRSPRPASAASEICARLSLRDACRPPLRRPRVHPVRFGWVRLDNVCSSVPPSLEGGRTTESDGRSESFRKNLHPKQGRYLAYIHLYTRLHRRPPAEADVQQYFRVTPPSVHQIVLTLERAGFIRRQPGAAGSIEVPVDSKHWPELL